MTDNTPIPDAALAELDEMHLWRNESEKAAWRWAKSSGICYPALRQRLTEAEFQLSIQTVSSSMRGRSLLEAYKQIEDLQTRLAEAERERDELREYRDAEAIRRAKADCYDRICERLGVESNVLGWLATRDARMKREGAAEWLEAFAKKDAFEKLAYLQDETLLEAAQRLRDGK